ncbi:caspase-14 [Python bivittatus]|uniref:Caspase-14 n=1 Tax=Python bivittatus TaxID=176946 RepID=A0A9F2R169_PYTBI|nr:caspase-14 [Python bivittatus]
MEREKIKRVLDELSGDEFKELKYYLEIVSTEEESARSSRKISRSALDKSNSSFGLADLLVQHYTERAVPVLAVALERVPRLDLVGKLREMGAKPREPSAPKPSKTPCKRECEDAPEDEPHLERYEMRNRRVAFMMCVTKNRDGSEEDIGKMKKLFEKCRFITPLQDCINPSKEKLMDDLKEFQKYINTSTEEISCCLITLMSHGKQGIILDPDKKEIILDEIFLLFNNKNCPKLQGKPKIFIIQACQGNDRDYGIVEADDKIEKFQQQRKLPTASDYFIVYSSQKGFVSLRNSNTGSVMITAMDEVFSAHWQNWHVGDLFTKVNGMMVKQEFRLANDTDTVKACLVTESTLTKAVFLK